VAPGRRPKEEPAPRVHDPLEPLIDSVVQRINEGAPVLERCSMMNEILEALNAFERPRELRERAIETLLQLSRRAEHESPCTRGLREMSERMGALDGKTSAVVPGCSGEKPRP
jgi:hypothetical protein